MMLLERVKMNLVCSFFVTFYFNILCFVGCRGIFLCSTTTDHWDTASSSLSTFMVKTSTPGLFRHKYMPIEVLSYWWMQWSENITRNARICLWRRCEKENSDKLLTEGFYWELYHSEMFRFCHVMIETPESLLLTLMTCSEVWTRAATLDWLWNEGVGCPHGKMKRTQCCTRAPL